MEMTEWQYMKMTLTLVCGSNTVLTCRYESYIDATIIVDVTIIVYVSDVTIVIYVSNWSLCKWNSYWLYMYQINLDTSIFKIILYSCLEMKGFATFHIYITFHLVWSLIFFKDLIIELELFISKLGLITYLSTCIHVSVN